MNRYQAVHRYAYSVSAYRVPVRIDEKTGTYRVPAEVGIEGQRHARRRLVPLPENLSVLTAKRYFSAELVSLLERVSAPARSTDRGTGAMATARFQAENEHTSIASSAGAVNVNVDRSEDALSTASARRIALVVSSERSFRFAANGYRSCAPLRVSALFRVSGQQTLTRAHDYAHLARSKAAFATPSFTLDRSGRAGFLECARWAYSQDDVRADVQLATVAPAAHGNRHTEARKGNDCPIKDDSTRTEKNLRAIVRAPEALTPKMNAPLPTRAPPGEDRRPGSRSRRTAVKRLAWGPRGHVHAQRTDVPLLEVHRRASTPRHGISTRSPSIAALVIQTLTTAVLRPFLHLEMIT